MIEKIQVDILRDKEEQFEPTVILNHSTNISSQKKTSKLNNLILPQLEGLHEYLIKPKNPFK